MRTAHVTLANYLNRASISIFTTTMHFSSSVLKKVHVCNKATDSECVKSFVIVYGKEMTSHLFYTHISDIVHDSKEMTSQ